MSRSGLPVRRLALSDVGGPDGLTALVGPAAPLGRDLRQRLVTAPLVACIDGKDDPRPIIATAKHWHAWSPVAMWIACRVTRRVTGPHGTLLEAGCAYRAARLTGSDVGWEVVGPGAPDLVAFTRSVDGAAIMLVEGHGGRAWRRSFEELVARSGRFPVVLAPRSAAAVGPTDRRHLSLVR